MKIKKLTDLLNKWTFFQNIINNNSNYLLLSNKCNFNLKIVLKSWIREKNLLFSNQEIQFKMGKGKIKVEEFQILIK